MSKIATTIHCKANMHSHQGRCQLVAALTRWARQVRRVPANRLSQLGRRMYSRWRV